MNKLLFENSFKIRFLRHLVFFLITIVFFSGILYSQNASYSPFSAIWLTSVNALFFFSYAYITIFILIPEFLLKNKITWFILLFILIGIGLSAIKLVFSDHIFYSSLSPENIEKSGIMNFRFIVVNTKDMTFIVAFFCIAKYAKDYVYAETVRKNLEKQNKEAQRKLLQSQFDPHFLFNTINNLYALSLLNPLKTKNVIDRIKKVLHYIIDESQKDFVDLKDELALVENYIELEKLRYGKRLKVNLEISGDIERGKIPPMILFFLVENCFKHGSSLDAGTPWIHISLIKYEGKVMVKTANSKPKSFMNNELEEMNEKGLKNLKKRLKIIYSNEGFKLNIVNGDTKYEVELELNEARIEFTNKKYR